MATANETSTSSNLRDGLVSDFFKNIYCLTKSPFHWELTSGTSSQARDEALMIKSLTEILMSLPLLILLLKLNMELELGGC